MDTVKISERILQSYSPEQFHALENAFAKKEDELYSLQSEVKRNMVDKIENIVMKSPVNPTGYDKWMFEYFNYAINSTDLTEGERLYAKFIAKMFALMNDVHHGRMKLLWNYAMSVAECQPKQKLRYREIDFERERGILCSDSRRYACII